MPTQKEILSYLKIAAKVAKRGEDRSFFLGAIGVRSDGAYVYAFNGPTATPTKEAHCEYRISRRCDVGTILYVARVLRNGDFAMSRPCHNCMNKLISRGVKRVHYTVSNHEYGMIDLESFVERRKNGELNEE